MPLRIMAWNIENFGKRKIDPVNGPPPPSFAYIVESIDLVAPAILVVVEGKSGNIPGLGYMRNAGHIVSRNSASELATLALFQELRNRDRNWCVVPPRIHGASAGTMEGIAVFFKGNLVHFRGPQRVFTDVHNGSRRQSSSEFCHNAVAAPHTEPYDAPWDNALPATPPAGGQIGGLNQNQLAGKANFDNRNPRPGEDRTVLRFPEVVSRAPLLTVFHELTTPPRTITVFALHLPPDSTKAEQAVQNLMRITEVRAPLLTNEVRVILGDFNINLWNYQQAPGPAQPLKMKSLEKAKLVQDGGNDTGFKMINTFDPTMLKPTLEASPAGIPPYLDYIKLSKHQGRPVALDYIFAAYGINAQPLVPPTGYVVDRVVGTPMRDTNKSIHTALSGTIDAMKKDGDKNFAMFRTLHNYGKIRDASDHMAVYADL